MATNASSVDREQSSERVLSPGEGPGRWASMRPPLVLALAALLGCSSEHGDSPLEVEPLVPVLAHDAAPRPVEILREQYQPAREQERWSVQPVGIGVQRVAPRGDVPGALSARAGRVKRSIEIGRAHV